MGKKVLVIGSGGREHALVWKLSQSALVEKVYTAPGNAGTIGTNIAIPVHDIDALVAFAKKEMIDLTIVGPEEPLSLGVTDMFEKAGLKVFGPTKEASRLESSKSFAKEVMAQAEIPTAKWKVFNEPSDAKEYVRNIGVPCVLKADGLAAGKGVIIAQELDEALQAVDEIMEGSFGEAGRRLVIEEYLSGPEVSLLCFCDGKRAKPMVAVQDHKRALDGDQGLNTGGMGTYSPPPFWNEDLEHMVMKTVVTPVLKAMENRRTPFKGVLFTGLMLTNEGPKVLEFNVRFGDPETQVVMMRLKSDLYPILEECALGKLDESSLEWTNDAAICVVMAAPGYPQNYPKDISIHLPQSDNQKEIIFHAGTAVKNEQLVSSGGRVLGVCALGSDLTEARDRVYQLVRKIDFPQAHYRKDIGLKGLR